MATTGRVLQFYPGEVPDSSERGRTHFYSSGQRPTVVTRPPREVAPGDGNEDGDRSSQTLFYPILTELLEIALALEKLGR